MTAESQRTNPIPLVPGFLVSLSTATKQKHDRAIVLHREVIEEVELEDGSVRKKWKTTRVNIDPAEYKAATAVRLRVRSLVKGVCAVTPFGLICPTKDLDALDLAFEQARSEVHDFNQGSQHFLVRFSHMRGEIRENAEEAVAAVREEVNGMLADLERAVGAGDVKDIRDICAKTKQMGKLLDQESESHRTLDRVIKAARRVARQVVKRVEKNGEQLAAVLAEQKINQISQARFAFVEAEDHHDTQSLKSEPADDDHLPATSLERFAGLELPGIPAGDSDQGATP